MSVAAHSRPPISEATRARKRTVQLGRLFSEETRRRLSLAAKKRYENPEERRLSIEFNRLHCRTSEFRKQARDKARERWQDPEVIGKHSGPNCHLWRGGIAEDSHGPDFTYALRREIRQRDGYICQNPTCYLPENGKKHHVHHIDFAKRNHLKANLITLCSSCHAKTAASKREYWQEYYQSLQEMRGIT